MLAGTDINMYLFEDSVKKEIIENVCLKSSKVVSMSDEMATTLFKECETLRHLRIKTIEQSVYLECFEGR